MPALATPQRRLPEGGGLAVVSCTGISVVCMWETIRRHWKGGVVREKGRERLSRSRWAKRRSTKNTLNVGQPGGGDAALRRNRREGPTKGKAVVPSQPSLSFSHAFPFQQHVLASNETPIILLAKRAKTFQNMVLQGTLLLALF